MERKMLFALPVLAVIAIAGVAAAQPYWNVANLTQEQKDARLQMLDDMQNEMQEMINVQKQYLNGEITEEQYQEQLQEHHDDMQELHKESGFGCPMMGGGMGWQE
jgi:CHASE3 domain sensor protein